MIFGLATTMPEPPDRSPEILAAIEELLRRTMGLTRESVGSMAIRRSVRERMALCGIGDEREYWDRLRHNDEELQELIEQVIVPETSFFRHAESFATLAQIVSARVSTHHGTRIRALSAPCSTGEEAYSIAITLFEAGVRPEAARVDAIDISRRALARARRAVYGANSFRGPELGFRERYCTTTPAGAVVVDAVRACVHFEHRNLLSPALRSQEGAHAYDVIFCRNLLIYLDRTIQEQIMTTVRHLLAPDGYLFVGPAEATLASECGFFATGHSMSFAFQSMPPSASHKSAARLLLPQSQPQSRPAPESKQRAILAALPVRAAPQIGRAPVSMAASSPPTEQPIPAALERARALADAGRLTEAAEACEALLRQRGAGTVAEIYYLLAIVRDAMGDVPGAATQYRKVLFLEPGHRDAAAQLALLTRRQGDAVAADRLDVRARRPHRPEQ